MKPPETFSAPPELSTVPLASPPAETTSSAPMPTTVPPTLPLGVTMSTWPPVMVRPLVKPEETAMIPPRWTVKLV